MMTKLNKKDKIELFITIILIVFFIALAIAFSKRVKGLPAAPRRSLPRWFSLGRHFMFDTRRNKGTPLVLDKATGQINEIKRDPFSFGLSGEIQAMDLVLKGIIWGTDNPSAVINDSVLGAGETIGGFKIMRILRESVILENGTSTLELKLNQ